MAAGSGKEASAFMPNTITSPVYVVQDNIDTDQIIPAQYLTLVPTMAEEYEKLGSYALIGLPDSLYPARFVAEGETKTPYKIVIAGRNFGCGSSREHAPQALQRWGIAAIVGEGYSEIFFGNSVQLGLPCLTVSQDDVERLMAASETDPTAVVDVDVAGLTVRCGSIAVKATMPTPAHEALTTGLWDGTGLLLADFDQVRQLANQLPYVTGSW